MTGTFGSGQNKLGSKATAFFQPLVNLASHIPLQKYYPHILILALGYCAADITTLMIRPLMLPKAPKAQTRPTVLKAKNHGRSHYRPIERRNAFNLDGVIPPALTEGENPDEALLAEENDPVPSQLPLSVLGTIVHGNPERSVATIELKGRNKVKPYQVGDEIEGMAEVTEIGRRKIIFKNLKNNSRLEYIELKFDGKIRFGQSSGGATSFGKDGPDEEVKASGDNKFQLERSTILKYTNDLPSLLQEARAVPNRDPRTGEVNGFRVLDLKDDSIFAKLGIQRMDVIKFVNGEPVNSPKKAMELYQALRNESKIELGIERNGRSETFDYIIK